jgi:hypothetical protein
MLRSSAVHRRRLCGRARAHEAAKLDVARSEGSAASAAEDLKQHHRWLKNASAGKQGIQARPLAQAPAGDARSGFLEPPILIRSCKRATLASVWCFLSEVACIIRNARPDYPCGDLAGFADAS